VVRGDEEEDYKIGPIFNSPFFILQYKNEFIYEMFERYISNIAFSE